MAARLERNFYSPHEVAELEDVHVATVRRWVKKGTVPSYRSPGGRTIRIPVDYRDRIAPAGDAA